MSCEYLILYVPGPPKLTAPEVLYSTHAVQNRTPLPAQITRATALAALHNHSLLIQLNPLVISVDEVDPPAVATNSSTSGVSTKSYSMTDRIYLLPGNLWPSTVQYSGDFTNEADGVVVLTHAPMGFEGWSKWSIEDGEDGLEVVEEATIRCPLVLMPFIKSTVKSSHDKLHVQLVERLKKGDM